MKKKITFGNVENQGDDFLRYSRSLSYSERLNYLGRLRRMAFGKKYDEVLNEMKRSKKKIVVLSANEGESLKDFFLRVDNYKRNG